MELSVTNVLFLDTVPKEKIPDYLSILDIGVVHLREAYDFSICNSFENF